MMSNNEASNQMHVDQKKLKRMVVRIVALERENTKTNRYDERTIKNKIQSIIEEEAKKCY